MHAPHKILPNTQCVSNAEHKKESTISLPLFKMQRRNLLQPSQTTKQQRIEGKESPCLQHAMLRECCAPNLSFSSTIPYLTCMFHPFIPRPVVDQAYLLSHSQLTVSRVVHFTPATVTPARAVPDIIGQTASLTDDRNAANLVLPDVYLYLWHLATPPHVATDNYNISSPTLYYPSRSDIDMSESIQLQERSRQNYRQVWI